MNEYADKDIDDVDDPPPMVISAYGAPVWLTGLAQWLRDAGLTVIEYDGWQTRARGSGAYAAFPLCVVWHHTASPISWDGKKDADYIAVGDSDAPLANLYIQRNGTVWVIAAGATNTNGKGKSLTFSRGTVPQDGMNARAVGVEMGNDGVGEAWPQSQVDAMFVINNVVNAMCGNQPTDLTTHNEYAPDRKIDPARADAVQGGWRPGACNGSGSWSAPDIRAEALRRSQSDLGGNGGNPEEGSTMARALVRSGSDELWNAFVVDTDGIGKFWLPTNEALIQQVQNFGYDPIAVDSTYMHATGPVIGPCPENADEWGYWSGA